MELISYGVEELSNEDAAQLMSRIHECHECTGQWVLFQKTYTVLSQTGQTEVSVERSQQMWLTCLEHAQHNQHKHKDSAHAPQSEVVSVSFRSDSDSLSSQREGDRRNPSATLHPLQLLIQRARRSFAPRLPYALAAGAFALLVSAYLAAPNPDSSQNAPRIALETPLPSRFVSSANFQTPPHATTGMIDYHSAMGFEPFSDHLAPTLVATSAGRP